MPVKGAHIHRYSDITVVEALPRTQGSFLPIVLLYLAVVNAIAYHGIHCRLKQRWLCSGKQFDGRILVLFLLCRHTAYWLFGVRGSEYCYAYNAGSQGLIRLLAMLCYYMGLARRIGQGYNEIDLNPPRLVFVQ
jgi:hypothetical protein